MNTPLFTKIAMAALIVAVIGGLGFQCSSPNIQAGKLYFQQYQSSKGDLDGKDTVKLNSAIEMFRKEVTEKPNSGEGWYFLGLAEGMKKNFSELRTSWMKAKELGPGKQADMKNNVPYMYYKAFNHGVTVYKKAQMMPIESRKNALLNEAEQAYLTANYLYPDTAAKHNGFSYLANVYISQDRIDDAVKALERQIQMNPSPPAYIALGKAFILQGDKLKKAENKSEADKKYDDAIATLNNGIAQLAKTEGLTEEKRLAHASDLNQILLNAFIASDRLGEAESIFKENAESQKDNEVAQFNYGTILLNKGDFESSIVYLERAVTLNPKYVQALQNLAASYLRWGFKVRDEEEGNDDSNQKYRDIIKKAVPHIDALVALHSDDPTVYDLAAKVHASVGNNDKANEMFKKADELRSASEGK